MPLNRELVEMFKAMPRGLPGVKVFTYQGKSVSCITEELCNGLQKGRD